MCMLFGSRSSLMADVLRVGGGLGIAEQRGGRSEWAAPLDRQMDGWGCERRGMS